jgi:3-oxoacyl-[acyl-carrier-protein] synthase-3
VKAPERIYARITGTGSYLPSKVLTNHDLERMVETSDEWIVTRSGIRERRIAAPEEATSDLGLLAAERALKMSGVKARDLDLVIVATLTPDTLIPSTASIVQHRLGARKAAAFDLEAACTGFVYALSVADKFIRCGDCRHVLVVGAEVLSRWVDWTDRTTCVLFADGAGAAVLSADREPGVLTTHLFADGSKGSHLSIPAGGSRLPVTAQVMTAGQQYIKMAGSETFKVAVKAMTDAAAVALEATGLCGDDIDLLVPHQANIRIISATAQRVGIPMDRVMVNIDRYGNTSSATIPIALDEAVREGRIARGDTVMLDAFGAGLTWGSAIFNW